MFISLNPNEMYITPKGVIYKTNDDGIVDVNDDEDVKFLIENGGGKKLSKRQESAIMEEKPQ